MIMSAERIGMAACALIGTAGLLLFTRHVWNAGAAQPEPSGITVRTEILTIYAPNRLIALARAHPELRTHTELAHLVRETKVNVWYATMYRHHQTSGKFADILTSYVPGEWPEHFEHTKAVLLTLGGNPSKIGDVDYSKAKIQVFEDAIMEMGRAEGLRRLHERSTLLGELVTLEDLSNRFNGDRLERAARSGRRGRLEF
jgi:hypothetical protein